MGEVLKDSTRKRINRKKRRNERTRLGGGALPIHKGRSGRTGSMHRKKLASRHRHRHR